MVATFETEGRWVNFNHICAECGAPQLFATMPKDGTSRVIAGPKYVRKRGPIAQFRCIRLYGRRGRQGGEVYGCNAEFAKLDGDLQPPSKRLSDTRHGDAPGRSSRSRSPSRDREDVEKGVAEEETRGDHQLSQSVCIDFV